MYYGLADNLYLRGWKHNTCVLTDWLGRKLRDLTSDEFSVLVLCDGKNAIDSIVYT